MAIDDGGVDDLHAVGDVAELLRRTEQDHPGAPGSGDRRAGGHLRGAEVSAVAVDGDDRRRSCASMFEGVDSGPGAAAPLLVVLVLVIVGVRGRRDDLTTCVEAA